MQINPHINTYTYSYLSYDKKNANLVNKTGVNSFFTVEKNEKLFISIYIYYWKVAISVVHL